MFHFFLIIDFGGKKNHHSNCAPLVWGKLPFDCGTGPTTGGQGWPQSIRTHIASRTLSNQQSTPTMFSTFFSSHSNLSPALSSSVSPSSQRDADTVHDAPLSFFCPITGELMRDPVCTVDGQCYERASIISWFDEHNGKMASERMNPPTWDWRTDRPTPLTDQALTDNLVLRNSIEVWGEAYCTRLQRTSITAVQSKPPHNACATFSADTKIGSGISAASRYKEVHLATINVPGSNTQTDVAVLKVRTSTVVADAKLLLKLGRHAHIARFFGQCSEGE